MIEKEQLIRNWRELQETDDLSFFFQAFRPDGNGLKEAFHDVLGSDEVLPRVFDVFKAATAVQDAYFVVREPLPASKDWLIEMTSQHMSEMYQMCEMAQAHELLELLSIRPKIEIIEGENNWPPNPETPEVELMDSVNDFMFTMTPKESDFLLLDEAFYKMTCDYFVRHYLLWPLYRTVAEIDDPFKPYFELWKHGARPVWEADGLFRTYVEN